MGEPESYDGYGMRPTTPRRRESVSGVTVGRPTFITHFTMVVGAPPVPLRGIDRHRCTKRPHHDGLRGRR